MEASSLSFQACVQHLAPSWESTECLCHHQTFEVSHAGQQLSNLREMNTVG